MGVITVVHNIAEAIAKATEKPKPLIPLISFPSAGLQSEMAYRNIQIEVMPRDSSYYYTDAAGWSEVYKYIYFDFPMPGYIAERMDCDDFAILMKELCSALFGLNTCGAVMGQSPQGYHQWNLFRDDIHWLQLEPQTGEIFQLGTKDYVPQWILI